MITLLLVGRGRVGMPIDEQHAYIRDVHGASVVRLITDEPDVAPRRYVLNHVVASPPGRGGGPGKDVVT